LDISSVPVRPKSLSYSRPSPFWDDRDKRMWGFPIIAVNRNVIWFSVTNRLMRDT
jgi:hypothetical protein